MAGILALRLCAVALSAAGAISASFDLSLLVTGSGVLGSLGLLGVTGGLVPDEPEDRRV